MVLPDIYTNTPKNIAITTCEGSILAISPVLNALCQSLKKLGKDEVAKNIVFAKHGDQ
jgi:hypothetical protein